MLNEVLVVDDDPATCELIQDVLRSADIEAYAVTDSRKAAAQLRQRKFDAAFLDVRMPQPDGMELTRQVRESGLNQKTLIVMITGENEPRFLARAFQAGANFVLFKPVDRQLLLRLVRVTQGSIQQERRRFTRVNLCRDVSVECGEERVKGTTLDLSLTGMLVRADRTFPVRSPVRLSLELGPGKPALHENARVARVVGDDCMGLQLENVGSAESGRLREFLLPLILVEMEKAQQGPSSRALQGSRARPA